MVMMWVVIDSTWRAGEGPAKDSYNMGDNPQYRLSVEGGDDTCALWILLSRHITDKVHTNGVQFYILDRLLVWLMTCNDAFHWLMTCNNAAH